MKWRGMDFDGICIARFLRLFIIFRKWVSENHREHRGHREKSNSLCPTNGFASQTASSVVNLLYHTIHPEEIKKPQIFGCRRRKSIHPEEIKKPQIFGCRRRK
jgi:hypothetical protein